MEELNNEVFNNIKPREYSNSNNFLSNILENNNSIIWVILILIFLIFFCQNNNK